MSAQRDRTDVIDRFAPRTVAAPLETGALHQGRRFNVRTEDAGPSVNCVWTNITCDAGVVASLRAPYSVGTTMETVRVLMQAHQRAVIRRLCAGNWDEKLAALEQAAAAPSPPEPPPSQWPTVPSTLPSHWPDTPLLRSPDREGFVPARVALRAEQLARSRWVLPVASRTLVVHANAPVDILEAGFRHGEHEGLLLDAPTSVPLGILVMLDIRLASGPIPHFQIRGRTAWRRPHAGQQMQPGLGVQFLAEEQTARARLLATLQGQQGGRSEVRVPARLRVVMRTEDGALSVAHSADISERGMFVRTPAAIAPGTRLQLTVGFPDGVGAIALRGEVTAPRTFPQVGIGVRFLEGTDPKPLRELLSHVDPDRHAA